MLLGRLSASLFENLLIGKGATGKKQGHRIVRARYAAKRAGYGLKKNLILLPHPLTNFEIQKYYKNEWRFNCLFSRDNLPKKTKNSASVLNLDEHADVSTHWIALFCRKNEIV